MMAALPAIPPAAWRIGQLGFTAVMAYLLWRVADGPEILRTLADAQMIWLLLAVVLLICQTVLSAIRWKVTAAQLGQTLSVVHAVKEYFLSQVVNQALPGAVMGDAARAVRARGEAGLVISGQAVIFERLAGQIAMFVTMAVAFGVTFLVAGGLEWPATYASAIGTAVLIGTGVMGFGVLAGFKPDLIGTRFSKFIRPLHAALLSRQVLPAQIGLGAAITLCNLAAFAVCAWAVGFALPFAAVVAIVPVVLFSMLIPFTVSGWGFREGSAAVLLPLVGIAPSAAVAASVMFGIAMLIAVLPGLIVAGTK